jgi:hypothetical protein
MQPDELVLSRKDRIDLKRLRGLLVLARLRGFEDLSFWADIAMEWAEAAEAELARLRPKPGYPYIDGDALVTAAGRRYCSSIRPTSYTRTPAVSAARRLRPGFNRRSSMDKASVAKLP